MVANCFSLCRSGFYIEKSCCIINDQAFQPSLFNISLEVQCSRTADHGIQH
jgi:hypothetical protein